MELIHNHIEHIALFIFLLSWLGYSTFVHCYRHLPGNLYSIMRQHRVEWMKNSIMRDNRAADVMNMGNLMRSIGIFASGAIIIVGALMPLFRHTESLRSFLNDLPFITYQTIEELQFKLSLLAVIFIHAFFKFTWSLRQYQYASILLLARNHAKKLDKKALADAEANAAIICNAARHFSMGIKSFYFGIAVLSWFVNSYLFIAITVLIVTVLIRREFFSKALNIIANE